MVERDSYGVCRRERKRDRETERQRDRETERQRDREAERLMVGVMNSDVCDGDRERERERESERERERETCDSIISDVPLTEEIRLQIFGSPSRDLTIKREIF